MSYALLWVETLAAALLWQATLAAWAAKENKKWSWNRIASALFMLFPIAPLGLMAAATAMLKFSVKLTNSRFEYATSLLGAYLVGIVILIWQETRKRPGIGRAAAAWPPGRLAAAFLLAAAMWCMTVWNMDSAERAQEAFARLEAGAIAQSVTPPAPPDEQNAAIVYERAFERLPTEKSDKEVMVMGSRRGQEGYAKALAVAECFTATTAVLRKAAAMPQCWFDQPRSRPGTEMWRLIVGHLRIAALLLEADANNQADHGHPAAALEDVRAIYGIARHAAMAPDLMNGLVAMSIDAIANHTLAEILPAVDRADDLAGMEVDTRWAGRMFQRCLRGEEAFGLATMGNFGGGSPTLPGGKTGGPVVGPGDVEGFIFYRLFYGADDRNAYRRIMEEAQNIAMQPYFQLRDQFPLSDHEPRYGIWSSMIRPVIGAEFQTNAKAQALESSAQIALAMTRFRLDHGQLPAGLEELVPKYLDALPLDPFDGKPMRMVARGEDRLIYSVGPGGKEDGGATVDKMKDQGNVVLELRGRK